MDNMEVVLFSYFLPRVTMTGQIVEEIRRAKKIREIGLKFSTFCKFSILNYTFRSRRVFFPLYISYITSSRNTVRVIY